MTKLSKSKANALRARIESTLKGKRVLVLAGPHQGETAQVDYALVINGEVIIKLTGQDGKTFDIEAETADISTIRAI